MKRAAIYKILTWMTLVAAGCSCVPAATISIAPSTQSVNVGDTFTLDITVAGVSDLAAFQFDLAFNPAVLSAGTIAEGSFLPLAGSTFFVPGIIDNLAGTVLSTGDALAGPGGEAGSGILASVQFQAIAGGTSAISLSNIELLDSTLSTIPATSIDGTVTVSGAGVMPEPDLRLAMFLMVACIVARGLQLGRRAAS